MTAKKLKPICFFITPIGQQHSAERIRADQIQRHILNEVLSAKFKVGRADELPHPGSITHQIIGLLYNADLVIADLTGSNANVAYELAIRHSFNKVSIHLIDKSDAIPFDLKDERTVVFDLKNIDSIEECKEEIKKIVQVIASGKVKYSSPVFRTLGVAAATAEEKEGFLEKIAEQIDSIATDVSTVESTITMSDIDEIDSIKEAVTELEKSQDKLVRDVHDVRDDIRKILNKLELR
jgi:hypothetical protein